MESNVVIIRRSPSPRASKVSSEFAGSAKVERSSRWNGSRLEFGRKLA